MNIQTGRLGRRDVRASLPVQVLLVFLLCAPAVYGQTIMASISGIVSDPTGAVIAGAAITVKDLDRGVSYSAKSNETGFYLVPQLPPGRYQVTAEMTGFRTYVLDSFPLQTQQKASLNITLQVGVVTEKVEVAGSAQMVESTTATLSAVVENKKIIDLPLNIRNVYSLMRLVPGVFPSTPNSDSDFFTSAHRYSINGGRESTTDVQLDGVSTLVQSDIPAIYGTSTEPSVESVQEFRVQTNTFSAEYGRSGGGLVTMVTKSGTNEFHGSLFEFLRNNKLDANSWQANRGGVPLPARQQNQFGGSVGGPVIKDKTFFFITYEGKRINTVSFGQWTVPTNLERAGDFSQTRNAQGQLRVIYDPFSTRPDPNRPGYYLRDPMPGNIIPPDRIDPVSAKMVKYWPAPNRPGQPFTNALNLGIQASFLSPTDRYEFKVDHNFTAKQRVFVRYDRLTTDSADYDYWKNGATPGWGVMHWGSHNAAIDYTNTISSSTVVNGRLGLNRFEAIRPSFSLGFNVSDAFGWPASLDQVIRAMGVPMFPDINMQDVASLGQIQGPYYTSANTQLMGVANVSHVTGRHTTKVGFETRAFYLGFFQYGPPGFNFSRSMTQGPDPRSPSEVGGYGFASFLFGTGDGGSVAHSPKTYNYSKYYAAYVQDDFKLTRKLTLNLGLRWEIEGGNMERFDRMSVNDLTVRNPISDKVGFDVRGGYLFAGTTLGRKAIVDNQHVFNPRVGIAYELNPKTTIRTGYGIFYGVPPFSATTGYVGGAFSSSTTWVATLDGITPKDLLRNPFPTNVYNLPTGSALGLLTAVGYNLNSGTPSTLTTPYNQQWNFTIQREITRGTVLEVAYAGNKGTHLSMEWGWPNQNQLWPALMTPDNHLTDLVNNPFAPYVKGGTLAQSQVQRAQLLRPYPLWQTVNSTNAGWGNSNYHALQTRFERRFAGGTSLMAAFTWSKVISDSSDGRWNDATGAFGNIRNAYCRACDRSISSYDQPKRFVLNFTYEFPFGKGKHFGGNWNRITNGVLGGWQANGILTLSGGLPIVISQSSNTTYSFGGNQHPDTTGVNADLGGSRSVYRWFDTAQFSVAKPYTFGNLNRTTNLRQDWIRTLDFSLFKTTNIYRERVRLQFRAEAFNLTNTPIFSGPNGNVQAATFGQVTSQANSPRQVQLALKLLF